MPPPPLPPNIGVINLINSTASNLSESFEETPITEVTLLADFEINIDIVLFELSNNLSEIDLRFFESLFVKIE